MSLAKELDKLKYDKRLLDWHVGRGKLSKDEVKKYLEALPDLASNVENLTFGQSAEANGADDAGPQGFHQ